MDLLKGEFGAADAIFIDETRLLYIEEGKSQLVIMDLDNSGPPVTFRLGELVAKTGPGWVIMRNYELDETKNFRANPNKSGIVAVFYEEGKTNYKIFKSRKFKGLVIPVGTLLKDPGSGKRAFEWEDWKECVTVLDLPEDYDFYVFHTHILFLRQSKSLRYYIFDFAPHTAGLKLNAAARGALPHWVKPLSKTKLPVTFSGEINGLKPWHPSTEYFPTENGILAIKVSPISWSKSVLDF